MRFIHSFLEGTNFYVQSKASILNINYSNYTKRINYNIDNISSVSMDYVNTLSELNRLWYEVLKNMNIYDESFGYLDNVKLLLELVTTVGKPTRAQAVADKNSALNDISNVIVTFSDRSTVEIKIKFKEDVYNTLNNMYTEDGY